MTSPVAYHGASLAVPLTTSCWCCPRLAATGAASPATPAQNLEQTKKAKRGSAHKRHRLTRNPLAEKERAVSYSRLALGLTIFFQLSSELEIAAV